ncbi:hypothetical protein Ccrd_014137 [Cynara cardunculus var. scolymus]|uniref:NAD(P)-binding domain-containing protein n=1 Tax=Cynara cardunculus var. scolymus TaxID=59895 RepID=A0A103YE95_CYNCS|nr:hypothetical protein Ccrd_014137 [Cynara cardunculus var. scolymus]
MMTIIFYSVIFALIATLSHKFLTGDARKWISERWGVEGGYGLVDVGSRMVMSCNLKKLYQKGIMVTVVCPGPIETSNAPDTSTSGQRGVREKRVSSERCAELTLVAASHGLKEAWISFQVLVSVL